MHESLKQNLYSIGNTDVEMLLKARDSYGESWCKRGGVGAFISIAKKWDRIEEQCLRHGYDLFQAIKYDQRAEGLADDLRDLRRYLLLIEEKMLSGIGQVQKDEPIYSITVRTCHTEEQKENVWKPTPEQYRDKYL